MVESPGMADQHERIEHRVVYRGRILNLEVDRVREPGGKIVEREVVRHEGSAVVLPVRSDGRLLLVRQYRYAVGDFLWEAPAGHLEAGESPEEAAQRELIEETGYAARRLERILDFFPAPGFTDESMHLFFASELDERGARPEYDETIETGAFTLDEAMAAVSDGRIRDAKTLIALCWFKDRRAASR